MTAHTIDDIVLYHLYSYIAGIHLLAHGLTVKPPMARVTILRISHARLCGHFRLAPGWCSILLVHNHGSSYLLKPVFFFYSFFFFTIKCCFLHRLYIHNSRLNSEIQWTRRWPATKLNLSTHSWRGTSAPSVSLRWGTQFRQNVDTSSVKSVSTLYFEEVDQFVPLTKKPYLKME